MEQINAYTHEYLELGLSPIPLVGKVAAYHWKDYKYNLRDFTKPGTSIGLRTGLLPDGSWFYVVDVDDKAGLGKYIGLVPKNAPIVSTGKGWHIYLRWKEQPRTRHYSGVDLIANGYVVAPPSLHASGKRYCFVKPLGSSLPLVNPESFTLPLSSITPSSITPGLKGDTTFAGVSQGQRHSTLVSLLGLLFARGYIEEAALAEMITWNKRCQPPLLETEVRSTVHTCWSKWDIFEV